MAPKSTLSALALLGALSLTACASAPNNASASAVVDPAAFETAEPSAVPAPGDDSTGIKAAVITSHDPSIHPTATQPTETPAPGNTSNQESAAFTATPMPSSAAVARSQKIMDGTWVQQDAAGLENYMDAVIHDGIIEVTYHLNHEELATPFWVGTFEVKTGSFSYVSHVDRAKLARAPYASDKETKEFTMENGVLSFPMTYEGATRIIHLEKQHS
ncbi:MAG: aspartate ammonia-lyase [Rothia mucilaginosa]|uniref:Aspartate ammonia-lyase n=1 Tax=Rothia mucilaginosa TaxID=43675 RepID=A0A930L627_9MICC|nr:aspartate ammonia-lyase [Rothia mucilaginosa]MBF1659619.1 aspartate ammonia-lyase [Rothia mucilaginosa]